MGSGRMVRGTVTAVAGGKVTLKTLPAGNYAATDLFTGAVVRFAVGATGSALPLTVTRWDTRAFSIVKV